MSLVTDKFRNINSFISSDTIIGLYGDPIRINVIEYIIINLCGFMGDIILIDCASFGCRLGS